jgi:protein-disulfide isomerase
MAINKPICNTTLTQKSFYRPHRPAGRIQQVTAALFFVLALGLVAGMPSGKASADTPAGTLPADSSAQMPVLDEAALKAAIAHRLRTAGQNKDKRFRQFTADQVSVERKIPVRAGDMVFFAVRIKISPKMPQSGPEFITMMVDKTGTLLIGSIQDLASGADLAKETMDQLQAVDPQALPPGFGKEIFSGPGPHTVIAVSDPFCPHCRQGWDHIKLNLDRIKTFRLAHYPLNTASEAACMVMADAYHRRLMVFEVVDFSYTQLTREQEPRDIVAQYMAAFPELAETWGKDPDVALAYLEEQFQAQVKDEKETARSLGIQSTPVFFINNGFLKGFNAEKMAALMP